MMRRDKSDAAAWASSCETVASLLLALPLPLCCLTSVFVTTWAKADEEVAFKLAFVSPALFFHFFSLFPPFHRLHFPQRALLPPITLPHSHVQSSADETFTFACEEWAALFDFFFCGWGRGSCCCCSCCFCCCICRCCICCCCCLILFNWVWICKKERVTEYEIEREFRVCFTSYDRIYDITYLSQLLIMCFDDTLLLAE